MRSKLSLVMACGVLFAAVAPLWAHHAFEAEFDQKKPVHLKGKVTTMEWINPHSWIHIDVKGPDGKVVNWMIEGGSPNILLRRGFTKKSLETGTVIVVDGYQAKSGESKCVGVFVEYLDGRKVFMGGSAPGANGQPAPSK